MPTNPITEAVTRRLEQEVIAAAKDYTRGVFGAEQLIVIAVERLQAFQNGAGE